MALLPPYGIRADYLEAQPPSAMDLNRRAKVLSAQLPGLLAALGPGVHGEDAFGVVAAGAGYNIAPGSAGIEDVNGYIITVRATSTINVSRSGDEKYIHIALAKPSNPGEPESTTGDPPLYLVSEDEELPDSLLLAEINEDGTVVDRRIFSSITEVQRLLAQLQSDLGYDAGQRLLGTIATRLTALEGGGEEGEGPVVISYLSQLKYSASDPRNAVVVIEEKIAAALAQAIEAVQNGGVRPQVFPLDQLRALIDANLRGLGEVNPQGPSRAHAATIVLGVRGDGSGDTEDNIGAHTSTIRTDLGVIEP
jgi:hypothetical protein